MKKIFIKTAMASMLCMGFVSCADRLDIKSVDPLNHQTYTVEGLLAKQYATLGLTGQKGPAGLGDISGDEGETGLSYSIQLEELMTDETLWAYQGMKVLLKSPAWIGIMIISVLTGHTSASVLTSTSTTSLLPSSRAA